MTDNELEAKLEADERDAARYRFIVTCTDEAALDLLAEAVGDRERMDSIVDALIAEDAALRPYQGGENP